MWSRLTDGKRDIVIATKLGQGHPLQREGHPADGPDGGRRAGHVAGARRTRSSAWSPSATRTSTSSRPARKATARRPRSASTARQRRGGKGLINLKVTPKIGHGRGASSASAEDDLLIVTVSGKVIRIKTTQVRPSGRATQGVRLINLEEKDRVTSVADAREIRIARGDALPDPWSDDSFGLTAPCPEN